MRPHLLAGFAAAALLATTALAQDIEKREFNVVGTWGFLNNWQKLEKPFWTEELPKASGGNLKGNAKALTEVNLKGTELLRLTKQGVFDFAAVLPAYIDDGAAVIEASDIAGVSRDFKTARAVGDAWMPEMQKVMRERHGAVVLATFAFPAQVLFCRGEVKGLAELRGKKIRVAGVSQGDFVEAIGASSVTMTFAEVLPALEKGVVDCGITGTMSGYKAKWPEVTQTMITLPVSYGYGMWVANANVWGRLSKPTQDLITRELKSLEDRTWALAEADSREGIACVTGKGGECTQGPAAKLALVEPSEADLKIRDTALNDVGLARWAKRCGAECAARWTEVVGKGLGFVAKEK